MSDMPLTKKQRESLAHEILNLLIEHELFYDVSIYFNGKRYSSYKPEHYNNPNPEVMEDVEPHECFEYARKPNILSMSFEGPLYSVLNYHNPFPEFMEKFDAIFNKYGLYYELGNAWNLSAYEG